MDPISPRSLKLLQAYFDARCDIFILAQKERLPVLDLIRWSQSEAVQSHIAALKKLTDDSIHLRTAQARLLSLDTLEKIVKTTDDPHELRRAASVIYRGGATMPQPRPPRAKPPDPDNPPPRYLPPDFRRMLSAQPEAVRDAYHPACKPSRPTAHDSFNARSTIPHPPPPGEMPPSSAAEGAPPRHPLPTLPEPKSQTTSSASGLQRDRAATLPALSAKQRTRPTKLRARDP